MTTGLWGPVTGAPLSSWPSFPPGCDAPSQAGDRTEVQARYLPPCPAASESPGGPVRNTCRAMCVGVAVQGGRDHTGRPGPTPYAEGHALPAGKAPPRGRACVSNSPATPPRPCKHARRMRILPCSWCSLPVAGCKVCKQVGSLPCAPVCQTHVRCLHGRMRGNARYLAIAT